MTVQKRTTKAPAKKRKSAAPKAKAKRATKAPAKATRLEEAPRRRSANPCRPRRRPRPSRRPGPQEQDRRSARSSARRSSSRAELHEPQRPSPRLHTRICEMFGIEYPIIQTGMGWVSGAKPDLGDQRGGGPRHSGRRDDDLSGARRTRSPRSRTEPTSHSA